MGWDGLQFAYKAAFIALMVLANCRGAAQQSAAPGVPTVLEGDRSFYQGKPVMDPDGLSGLWEISNGKGGARGIHLILSTSVDPFAKSDRKTLTGVEQQWEHLEIGVYERQGPVLAFGEEGFFSDSPRGGGATLEDGHLQLHFVSRVASTPSVDLDLMKEAGDRWVGRFHKGDFDEQVTLERPGGKRSDSVITGTWRDETAPIRCMHVVEQAASEFTGWSDRLQIPGTIGFAPWIQPHRLFEIYGEWMKVKMNPDETTSFEFSAFTAMCCSHTYIGKLDAGAITIEGRWPPGPNQAPQPDRWRKVAGESCANEKVAGVEVR